MSQTRFKQQRHGDKEARSQHEGALIHLAAQVQKMATEFGDPRLCRPAFLRYDAAMNSPALSSLIFGTPIITETIAVAGPAEAGSTFAKEQA